MHYDLDMSFILLLHIIDLMALFFCKNDKLNTGEAIRAQITIA